jgi:integrase
VLPYPAAPDDVAEFLQHHAPPLSVRSNGEFEVLATATSASGAPVKSLMTLTSYLATLAFLHRAGGLADPTKDPEVQAVWRVLRRGLARPRQKSPLTWAMIEPALARLPESLIGKRDRALLVLGYACMARRSELVALDVEHFEKDSDGGATVSLRRIKTNADWTGYLPPRVFGIVEEWLTAAGISSGPVFRRLDFIGQKRLHRMADARLTPLSVTHIYKRVARLLAIPELDAANISSHSARIGAANDLIEDGAPDAAIMRDAGLDHAADGRRVWTRRESEARSDGEEACAGWGVARD